MFEEKKYYCVAFDESYTESELKKFFVENCDDYDGNFSDYVRNSLVENNGELMIPKMVKAIYHKGQIIHSVWNIKSDLC